MEADDEPSAPDPGADDPEPPASAGPVGFASDVWPIFNSKCGPCHVSAGFGNQNIGSTDMDEALADAVRLEEKTLSDLNTGRMPSSCASGSPGDPGCVTVAELELIERWYEEGAAP
jgi:hypothetical protein